jgi:NAD(P)-dependent dehydrogenase (short-subunit alcohol dehydrogenase family)
VLHVQGSDLGADRSGFMNRGLILAGAGDTGDLAPALDRALTEAGWRVGRLAFDGVEGEDAFDTAFDRVLQETGELGGLVLLAHIRDTVRFAESDSAAWTAPLFAPLTALFLAARRATDELVGGGAGGRMLVVVSAPVAPRTIAATQQAALVSLARSIATEYGRSGVACNALIVREGNGHGVEAAVESARFLLSEDAGYVTGEVVDLGEGRGGGP